MCRLWGGGEKEEEEEGHLKVFNTLPSLIWWTYLLTRRHWYQVPFFLSGFWLKEGSSGVICSLFQTWGVDDLRPKLVWTVGMSGWALTLYQSFGQNKYFPLPMRTSLPKYCLLFIPCFTHICPPLALAMVKIRATETWVPNEFLFIE